MSLFFCVCKSTLENPNLFVLCFKRKSFQEKKFFEEGDVFGEVTQRRSEFRRKLKENCCFPCFGKKKKQKRFLHHIFLFKAKKGFFHSQNFLPKKSLFLTQIVLLFSVKKDLSSFLDKEKKKKEISLQNLGK